MESSALALVDARPMPTAVAVLHVEDDMMLKLTISARISQAGIPVEQASNGAEALALVRQRRADGRPPFSLVLMDNMMPGMSGAECTVVLRQEGYDGLIVGISGDSSNSEDALEFVKSGLDGCLEKTPQGIDSILDLLRLQLERVGA